MSFQQGLSGVNAAAKQLDVISNNVANASTVGFKGSRTEFADMFATSLQGTSATQAGIGASTVGVTQQFQQGNVSATNNPLDIAISGQGFFRFLSDKSSEAEASYSRNGQFKLDKEGYMVNNGYYLAGYSGLQAGGEPTPIRIDPAGFPGEASTAVDVVLNLDATAKPKLDSAGTAMATFDPKDSKTYNFTTSAKVFDNFGTAHNVGLFFQRQAVTPITATSPGALIWNVYANLDGGQGYQSLGTVTISGGPPSTVPAGQLLTPFTPTISPTAALSGPAGTPANFDAMTFPNKLSPIKLDLGASTQYAGDFAIATMNVDGAARGDLVGLSIEDNGTINARYSNNKSKQVGTIPLFLFQNVQGLQPTGDNRWVQTAESGLAVQGTPGGGRFGSLQSSATEDSSVDTTAELVNMIVAQRFYQANAQSIKTQDSVLQTLLNLR